MVSFSTWKRRLISVITLIDNTPEFSGKNRLLNNLGWKLFNALFPRTLESFARFFTDLLVIAREFINPDVSRSGLARCLKRHQVNDLKALTAAKYPETDGKKPVKTFKDYEPGFLHIDIKYLPKMPDEEHHRYLFVAIDRATRWVYFHIYPDQTEVSSVDFLRRVKKACSVKIEKILTDNGTQFTDRFTSKEKQPTGNHAFDQECAQQGIEHRLIPPRHPQTNGMVERFNGRISELVQQTRFASAEELEKTLYAYLKIYNHHIPQKALKHQTPIQALKIWQQKKPDIFVKKVYDQAGLDN
jgi:transposase-like protein